MDDMVRRDTVSVDVLLVAQRLDELSDEFNLPELRDLSDDLGEALKLLDPANDKIEGLSQISNSGVSIGSLTASGVQFYTNTVSPAYKVVSGV